METKCPHCNVIFKTPNEYKGKKIKCPKCKQIFVLDSKNENRSCFPKAKWKIVAIFALLGVFTLIGIIGYYRKVKNSERKATYQPYSKNRLGVSTTDNEVFKASTNTQINKSPEDYIFKPVKSLTPAERRAVLDSGLGKVKSILRDEDKGIDHSWVTVYTEPMTATEVEVLGDYFLEQRQERIGNKSAGLKMQVFWNIDVAEVCQNAGYYAESQFYNSYWECGRRVSGANPKYLDEDGLYKSLCNDWSEFFFGEYKNYDKNLQISYVETPVRCMTELIFNTFSALQDGLRCCVFDRLPNLKAVRITYKDTEENVIGGATLDFRYWAKMIKIESTEIDNKFINERETLFLKYDSKLITEKEFYTQNEHIEKRYQEVQANYYQKKWLELFPLIKDFSLDKELPLRTKDFNL